MHVCIPWRFRFPMINGVVDDQNPRAGRGVPCKTLLAIGLPAIQFKTPRRHLSVQRLDASPDASSHTHAHRVVSLASLSPGKGSGDADGAASGDPPGGEEG